MLICCSSCPVLSVYLGYNLNPIKHKLVQNLTDWEFSNYHECIGTRNGELYDEEFFNNLFHSKSNYREFVEEYIPITKEISKFEEFYLE